MSSSVQLRADLLEGAWTFQDLGDSTPMTEVTMQAAAAMVGLETHIIIIARAMMAWVDSKEGANNRNMLAVGEVVDLNNAGWKLQLLVLLTLHLIEKV
jgi:hypothetical protein